MSILYGFSWFSFFFLVSSAFFEEESSFKGPLVYSCIGWGFCSWFLFGVSLFFNFIFALNIITWLLILFYFFIFFFSLNHACLNYWVVLLHILFMCSLPLRKLEILVPFSVIWTIYALRLLDILSSFDFSIILGIFLIACVFAQFRIDTTHTKQSPFSFRLLPYCLSELSFVSIQEL